MIKKLKEAFLSFCVSLAFKNVHLKLWEAFVVAAVLILVGAAAQVNFGFAFVVLVIGVIAGLVAWKAIR